MALMIPTNAPMAVVISMAVVINDDQHRFYYNKNFVTPTIQDIAKLTYLGF